MRVSQPRAFLRNQDTLEPGGASMILLFVARQRVTDFVRRILLDHPTLDLGLKLNQTARAERGLAGLPVSMGISATD